MRPDVRADMIAIAQHLKKRHDIDPNDPKQVQRAVIEAYEAVVCRPLRKHRNQRKQASRRS